MNNIKGLVTMRISPVTVDEAVLSKAGVKASPLFSSSAKSWEMKDNINLNPMFLMPPREDVEKKATHSPIILKGHSQVILTENLFLKNRRLLKQPKKQNLLRVLRLESRKKEALLLKANRLKFLWYPPLKC